MKMILNPGFVITAEIITTKKGNQIQIVKLMDSSGGTVTLMGDKVRLAPEVKKMIPCTIEADVTVSNYNGVSFMIENISVGAMKV